MTRSADAWEEVVDALVLAEDRFGFALAAEADVVLSADDAVERLEMLFDVLVMTRRALSQACGWIETTLDNLERETYDDTGAGAEREGEGPALPGT